MNKEEARLEIRKLIEKYELVRASHSISKYTEEETKKDFILPLFRILGWDIDNKNEVTAEEYQSSGRVDYGFYLDGRLKFYLEAKALKSDLNQEGYANQAVKYSWNKGATWAILTDFESLKVFNAQDIDSSLANKLVFEIPYLEYTRRFDQLWLLSKEAFKGNLLDKDAEQHGKKLQKVSVGASLYKDLTLSRNILTDKLHQMNPGVDSELLDEGVQRLLDRLIFIRVAEDRGIEPPTLVPLIREWNSRKTNKTSLYKSMSVIFRELDGRYNSSLFKEHPFENWEDWSNVTEQVVKILQGKSGYYEYDFKHISSDVLGGVYENYLGYRLSKSKDGLTLSKDANKRKEHGIYYTPSFIVDYIVKNALTPVLDKCKTMEDLKKIKVLDPACGSGSFLVKALEILSRKYREFDRSGKYYSKMSILINNIYGVDLDQQAVELTKLNLLLTVLSSKAKLPSLDNNIKNGNSLISGTDDELKKYFGKNFRDKIPFNWKEEFPEVFKQGGFDVIVGNPPYIQLSMEKGLESGFKNFLIDEYRLSMGRLNTFGFFIIRGLRLLRKNGYLGYIVPNTLLTQDYYEGLRKLILQNLSIKSITNFDTLLFKEAVVESIVIILQKTGFLKEDSGNMVTTLSFNENLQPQSIGRTMQGDFNKSYKFNFNLNTNSGKLNLKEKIDNSTLPLNHFLNINQGIALKHERKRYLGTEKLGESYKPVLDGRFINRYLVKWNGNYLKYDLSAIHSSKNENIFLTKEKLFFRRVGSNLVATYDDKQFYALNTLVVMNLKEKSKYDIKYLLGLFNSLLFNFYYKTFLKSTKKVFSEIQAHQVGQLPIKNINFNDHYEEIIHDSIKNFVEMIIGLKQELLKVSENSEKWKSIKSEIEETDKKIDEEVYKLYDLTPKEIKIVEKSVSSH